MPEDPFRGCTSALSASDVRPTFERTQTISRCLPTRLHQVGSARASARSNARARPSPHSQASTLSSLSSKYKPQGRGRVCVNEKWLMPVYELETCGGTLEYSVKAPPACESPTRTKKRAAPAPALLGRRRRLLVASHSLDNRRRGSRLGLLGRDAKGLAVLESRGVSWARKTVGTTRRRTFSSSESVSGSRTAPSSELDNQATVRKIGRASCRERVS